jgi:hypothetical protein
MPQFDAEGIVEGLQCKLKPYADFDGLVPEPTDAQVGAFLAGLKKALRESRDRLGAKEQVDVTDPEQVAKAFDDMDPGEFERTADLMAGLHAALCGEHDLPDGTHVPGTPSKEQILAVPSRRRVLFFRWLQNEVLSPEAAPGGGKTQPRPLRAAG